MTTDLRPAEPSPPPSPRRRRWWWAVGVVAGLAVGLLAWSSLFRPHVFSGAVLQSSTPAPAMDGLTYADGDPVDLNTLRGDVVLVYFGYTHCPDVCPTMLSTVADAVDDLGPSRDRVRTMMVTVDPERDTPELLGSYVSHFDESFRGVWGPEDRVRSVATLYGVHFEHDDPADDGSYLVGHTASLMAIDPEGVLRIVYPVGLEAGALERDLEELLG